MENESANLTPGSEEHLAFEVGGQSYAVAIASVREIRGWTEPSSMPDAEAYILGVINLRGEVLPLLDLAPKLGLETPEISERSVIIVVEIGKDTIGLLVDSVSNIIAPPTDEIKKPPETARNGESSYVSALTLVEEEIVRILNLSSMMPKVPLDAT